MISPSKDIKGCTCDEPSDIFSLGNGFFCGRCRVLIQTIGRVS